MIYILIMKLIAAIEIIFDTCTSKFCNKVVANESCFIQYVSNRSFLFCDKIELPVLTIYIKLM